MVRLDRLTRMLDFDRGVGPVQGRGRHRARRPQPAARRARSRVREPRRHRPPVGRRLDLHRHPRHRRALPQRLRPDRGDGAGHGRRRRSWRSPTPTPTCCARPASGLGALGVIYSVTVRTVPAFTLDRLDAPRPLAETLDRLDELNAGDRPLRVLRLPAHRDGALPREPPHRRAAAARAIRRVVYAQEVMLENWVGQLFALAARAMPSQAPRLSRIASRRGRAVAQGRPLVQGLRLGAADPLHRDGVGDPARARPRRRSRRCSPRRTGPSTGSPIPIEVRFVAADDSMLSPSHQRDTCYIAVHQDRKLDWEPYFRAVEEIARLPRRPAALGQAPLPDRRRRWRPLYPRWDAFQRRPRRASTPAGTSRNDYTDRVLGPVAPFIGLGPDFWGRSPSS